MHDLVIASDQLGIDHGRAAAAVAMFGVNVVGGVIEQLVAAFDVCPAVGVEAQALGNDAGIFEVADAVVIGGQGHKSTVRFGDACGNAVFHP